MIHTTRASSCHFAKKLKGASFLRNVNTQFNVTRVLADVYCHLFIVEKAPWKGQCRAVGKHPQHQTWHKLSVPYLGISPASLPNNAFICRAVRIKTAKLLFTVISLPATLKVGFRFGCYEGCMYLGPYRHLLPRRLFSRTSPKQCKPVLTYSPRMDAFVAPKM